MNTISIEELLKQQYQMLGHNLVENAITEIRIIRTGRQIFCHGEQDFIEKAQGLINSDCYVGINPRKSESGFATDVSHVSCIVVDIDPIRAKETPSTDEELESSLNLGRSVASDLGGYVVSSGSGCHVYFPILPIAITNHEAITESLKTWMDLVRDKYAPKGKSKHKIDAIFDLPRVVRIWGSLNTRSNRLCGPQPELQEVQRLSYSFSQTKTQGESKAVDTTEAEARFNNLLKHNKRLQDITNGTVSYPSPSESDFEFVALLARAHFSVDEIESLSHRNPHGNKPFKKGDVKRIVGKIVKEEPGNAVSLIHGTSKYEKSLAERGMGMRTGLAELDDMISGIKNGKLIIMAARPGEGKTTLGVQLGFNLARQYGTVTFHPTEIGADPIFDKIVSRCGVVDLRKFQNGTFLPADKDKINKAVAEISKVPFIVIEDFTLTIDKIEADLKKYAPKVAVIDFFQALSWMDPQSAGEKYAAVKRIKKLAQDLNIAVILMSQLARSKDKPTLASLSETKALEEYGDVICFLNTKTRANYPRQVYLDVHKSKYSETGLIRLDFDCKYSQFVPGNWVD